MDIQLLAGNGFLDRVEEEIMDIMRHDINSPVLVPLIEEREIVKRKLSDRFTEVYK